MNPGAKVPKCAWHTSQLGYLEWHAEADRRDKRGEKQVRCPECLHYYWPREFKSFGSSPVPPAVAVAAPLARRTVEVERDTGRRGAG